MDASAAVISLDEERACAACGYLRRGIARDARCPECGALPPAAVEPVSSLAGAARDRAEQAWLAGVAVGLLLLVVSSVAALRVGLVMSIGGLSLVAVNAPAPKVFAAVLLQRSIGQPGEWGVLGTVAVLGNVLAVWFLTEPRHAQQGLAGEGPLSLRAATRWMTVLTLGGFSGLLLGGYYVGGYWWGWEFLPVLAGAVFLVELPVNTLLYCHLTRLSRRFEADGSRGVALLSAARWMVPLTCASGVAMSLVRGAMQDQPVVPWRAAQTVYGALALSTGMVASAGALQLLARTLLAATDQSVASLAGKLARLRGSIGKLAGTVRTDPARWAAVLGLAAWLWTTRPLLALTALSEHRMGLGGDLPMFNFVGPKVWAAALSDGRYSYYRANDNAGAVLLTVLAVWLITSFRPPGVRAWQAAVARWVPTVLVGLAVGFATAIAQADYDVRQSYLAAGMMLGVEAPATFVVYAYLALLARAAARAGTSGGARSTLPRHVLVVAVLAAGLIVSPLGFYALSAPLRAYRTHPAAIVASAAYGALAVCAGVVAWAVVARLTWTLAAWRRR